MDPLACWKRLCDACEVGDLEEAAYAADDLSQWLLRGGFRPKELPKDVTPHTLSDFAHLCGAIEDHWQEASDALCADTAAESAEDDESWTLADTRAENAALVEYLKSRKIFRQEQKDS